MCSWKGAHLKRCLLINNEKYSDTVAIAWRRCTCICRIMPRSRDRALPESGLGQRVLVLTFLLWSKTKIRSNRGLWFSQVDLLLWRCGWNIEHSDEQTLLSSHFALGQFYFLCLKILRIPSHSIKSCAKEERKRPLSFCPWWEFDCVIYDRKGGNLLQGGAPEENQQSMKS